MTMSADNPKMQFFIQPGFALSFQFPETTPQGQPIGLYENHTNPIDRRYHVRTLESDEVFFEVSRYAELDPHAAHENMVHDYAPRYEGVTISDLIEIQFAGQPATSFTDTGPNKARKTIYIPYQQVVYRIVYNLGSPLNRKIAETVRFDQPG